MVTLNTYSPTRTEPADIRKIMPQIALVLALTTSVIAYTTLTGLLDPRYLFIIIPGCFGSIMLLRYGLSKQRVPAKDGQLSISDREITFNSREDGFRTSIKDVNSIVLTYSGYDSKLFFRDESGVENRIAITFTDGQTFKRTIEIANARQKKALKREIEELHKAGVRNITIRNASESEWGKF